MTYKTHLWDSPLQKPKQTSRRGNDVMSLRLSRSQTALAQWGEQASRTMPGRVMGGRQCHWWRLDRLRGGSLLLLTRIATKPSSDPLAPRTGGGRRAPVQQTESTLQHTRLRETRYCQRAKTPPACHSATTHTHSDIKGMAEGAMQVPMCSSSAPLSTGMPSNRGPGRNHDQANFITPLP